MKKQVNDWRIIFFEYHPTYIGLITGEPDKKLNDDIITRSTSKLINNRRIEKESINVILDYAGYYEGFEEHDKNEFALKPIMVQFKIFRHDPDHECTVITFTDEDETPEKIIERITNEKIHELVKTEWEY